MPRGTSYFPQVGFPGQRAVAEILTHPLTAVFFFSLWGPEAKGMMSQLQEHGTTEQVTGSCFRTVSTLSPEAELLELS